VSIGLLFWVLMILALIFGWLLNFRPGIVGSFGPWGNNLLVFVLLGLLGWGVFGPPLHG
jgi:hypothetical protein